MPQRTIVITGASDGIGAESARTLAARGERVIVVGRSRTKTEAVAKEAGAEPLVADFARLDEVRDLAAALTQTVDGRIDVLANNAGGILASRRLTVDGNESTFQVNHLAPFLLTHLLLDELRAARGSVIASSSIASHLYGRLDMDDLQNERHYSPRKAYGDAKLANILFTRGVHARHHGNGISAMALHPGNVASNFASESTSVMRVIYRTPLRRLLLVPVETGGATLTWAIDGRPGVDWEPGNYYDERVLAARANPQQHDDTLVEDLWSRSEELVGIGSR